MTLPSFEQYALIYDLIYQDKPYAAEVDYLEAIFRRFGKAKISSVLDIAAGTGGHLELLASRGYKCAGSDLSERMIEMARFKAKAAEHRIDYVVSPMQCLDLGTRKFDAVICMFSAIDYLGQAAELDATMQTVRRHLNAGGLFIFDYWNGIEASRNYSPVRVRECARGDDRVIRVSESSIDLFNNRITVNFDLTLFRGSQVVSRFKEEHRMRYFFPLEMQELLERNGFDVVHSCPFMGLDQPLTPAEWNIGTIATPRSV